MLNRRHILTGSLVLLGGCAARATTAPSGGGTTPPPSGGGSTTPPPTGGTAPVVGPHATWNGAAGSGGSAPSDPTRTTAKAIGQFLNPSRQRIAANLTIQVMADAYGGVSYVEFSGDCVTTRVDAPIIVVGTDVNGRTLTHLSYAITLDHAAFRQRHADGNAVNIYARVVPTNSAVQQRVIGPLTVYPEAAANDGAYNVALSGAGGAYTTLRAALSAAQAAGKKAPLVTIKETGFYELQDSTWGTYANGLGYCVITHDPGVVATLGRAAAFNPTNRASWCWTPGWDGVEFRGSGIVIDQRNITQFVFGAQPAWFNGCKVTNSIGTRDSLYWNKSPHPGFGPSIASYWTDATFEYGPSPLQFQKMVTGCKSVQPLGDIYTGTMIVVGNQCSDASSQFFTAAPVALTVQYQGAGAGTLTKTGGNGQGTLVLTDAAGSLTIPLGAIDNLVDVTTVAATINGRAGWTATAGNTAFAGRYLCVSGYPNNSPAMDVKTTSLAMVGYADIHADWFQGYGGVENAVIWNNTLNGTATYLSQVLRNDGVQKDMSVCNNVWMPQNAGAIEWGGPNHQHILFRNNTTSCYQRLDGAGDSQFSLLAQNLYGGVFQNPTDGPQFRDNAVVAGTLPTGTNYSGNFTVTALTDVLVNWTGGNYAPKGALLNNLKARLEVVDGRSVVRPATDAVGAWSTAT